MAVRDHRSLEKSLFSPGSRRFFRLKSDQVRLLFIGLVLVADDFGRLEGDGCDLVALFPKMGTDAATMIEYVRDLAAAGLVTQYKVGADKYIEINNFVEHQEWHGVSNRTSKIPPNPKAVLSTSRGGRIEPVAVVAEFGEKSAATPKSIPSFTYTKETIQGTATATTATSEDAYRQAKRIFRTKVGKSIGSLSNRGSQWDGLVQEHGADVIVAAVEIWATELGKGGRNLTWPLAVFLKNSEEFIEAAKNTETERKESEPSYDMDAVRKADDEDTRRKNKEFTDKLEKDAELEKISAGSLL